jgi:hypothetical protein
MQDSSCRPAENPQGEMWGAILLRYVWSHRGVRVSVVVAMALLAWDVATTGSFLVSLLVCPIWFFGSVLKGAIQRPGWSLALVRSAIPALTLGLVLANNAIQIRIAEANAPRIIAACEGFRATNGEYPKMLAELVPRYMPSVPPAKYCLVYGEFQYFNAGRAMLVWCVVPPFGRRIYDFEERRWNYLD